MYCSYTSVAIAACATAAAATNLCTLVSNSTTACGVYGKLSYNYEDFYVITDSQIVGSLSECAAFCGRRRYNAKTQNKDFYCRSFSYQESTGFCQLGGVTVEEAVRPGKGHNQVFYDITCFDCGPLCPHEYGEQLLQNGGFEGKLLGPWVTVQSRIGPGKDSKQAYFCKSDVSPYCELSQVVNTCPGMLYELSADYKAIATSPKGTFLTALSYGDRSNDTAKDAVWKSLRTFAHAFPGPRGPYFLFDILYRTVGNYYVDNVKYSRFPDQLQVTSGNVIENGGFESGKLTPWKTTTKAFAVVSPGIKSKHGLLFTLKPKSQSKAVLSQSFNTKPHQLHHFSFDGVAKGSQHFDVNIWIGPQSGFVKYTRRWNRSGNYTFRMPYYAKMAQHELRVSLSSGFQAHGTVLLDNFKLTEVAEP